MNPLGLQQLLWVLLGGALGSIARYGVGLGVDRLLGQAYPLGSTTVNLVGSFAFGFVWAWGEARGGLPLALRLFLLSGFMGAFTTFSTLMFEAASLFSSGKSTLGFLHLGLQNLLGLGCVFLGLWLGRD